MSEGLQKLSASPVSKSSNRRIAIVGAGIAGLTLAYLLQKQNIPFTIYEARNASSIGHSYSITLFRRPWRKLVNALDSKHAIFRQETAADRFCGGTGKLKDQTPADSATFNASDRDVRSWLVHKLQEKGIEINWNHKLSGISKATDGEGAALSFEKGDPVEADIIIDAGGLRSPAFEYHLTSAPKPKLLPYATYEGSRRMPASTFSQNFAHYFGTGNMIELVPEDPQTPFIQIKRVHLPEDGSKVELRWVYSRPPRQGHDPLYRPDRKPEEAKDIPNEFYDEVSATIKTDFSAKQRSMLSSIFDVSSLHDDRILNWHLRLRLPSLQHFTDNTNHDSYQVVAIGDAAHGLPIVQSRGAGFAAEDASNIARWLKRLDERESEHGSDLNFYKRPDVWRTWFMLAVQAIQRLRQCHGQSLLTRAELEDTLGVWIEGVSAEGFGSEDLSSSSDKEESSQDKGKL